MQGLNTVHVLWEGFKCPVVAIRADRAAPRRRHDTLMNITLSISENTIMNCYLFSYSSVSIIFSSKYSRT